MISKIGSVGILSLLVLTTLLSVQRLNEQHLKHVPNLRITELDFGREVVTFCMHEGVKIKLKLALDNFETEDVKVTISKGDVDLKVWEEVKSTYLINPKVEGFQVDIWVKLSDVKNIKVPVVNGKIAEHDMTGTFKATNAIWKPISEVYMVDEEYVKVISNWKLYGRPCE